MEQQAGVKGLGIGGLTGVVYINVPGESQESEIARLGEFLKAEKEFLSRRGQVDVTSDIQPFDTSRLYSAPRLLRQRTDREATLIFLKLYLRQLEGKL